MTKYRAENQVRGAVDGMIFDYYSDAQERVNQLNNVETSGTWWVETIEEPTTNTNNNNYSAGSSEGGSGLLWLIIILIIYALLGGK